MITIIVLIYGFLAVLYCGAAIFAQKDSINVMSVRQLVGFAFALILLSAIWPAALILDVLVYRSVHK